MKLNEVKIKNAKAKATRYKLADQGGLHLLVTCEGGKLWRWKYRIDGKEKQMAFGPWPTISLAEARVMQGEAKARLFRGIDPMMERKTAKAAVMAAKSDSFDSIARAWHEQWKGDKNPDHAESVWRRIDTDILPTIGPLPISQIDAPTVVAVIKKIESRGVSELARRAFGNIGQIYRYANIHGMTTNNPTASMKPGDILKAVASTNYARIEERELPALMRKIDLYQGTQMTRIAMLLMAHTFVRTSELIEAEWSEFDLEAKRWTIPAQRMKGTKFPTPHIVPLATQVLALLEDLDSLTGDSEVLFPGERGARCMSNNTILKALERMGYKGDMTGHGFRGLASTILHETGEFDSEHIDLQLAHMKRNKVSAAYNHAKYLKQRTVMMQWWADYLERARRQGSGTRVAVA